MIEVSAPFALAVDVGSSRVKLGRFAPPTKCTDKPHDSALPVAPPALPAPDETVSVAHRGRSTDDWTRDVKSWLQRQPVPASTSMQCTIASVHAEASNQLQQALRGNGMEIDVRTLGFDDVRLTSRVERPERVGIDRLVNAVAANRLRSSGAPALIVDAGTAVTIDLVAEDGAFEGGAIAPGPSLALSALHSGTSTLPLLPSESLEIPLGVVGRSTEAAIRTGVFWSVAAGVRRLVELHVAEQPSSLIVLVTGGAASVAMAALGDVEATVRHVPHLTLSGIAAAAGERLHG